MTYSLGDITCVIPARNERHTIGDVVARALQLGVGEVIVVDDASTDDTAERAATAGARVISHPYCKGNGAAIKSGARAAQSTVLAMLDGDGQHEPREIERLLRRLNAGFDLVVGSRERSHHANRARWGGNVIYNALASWMVGHRVPDLTSGFRLVVRHRFIEFLDMLPNGFSYPTTSTMAFFRCGYSVAFEPITVAQRDARSNSHIRLWRDGGRFLLIIFRIAALYSPLKLFFPTALGLLGGGLTYYAYTFFTDGRFTNFGALLLTTAVIVFLIGLVSEQITTLTYLATRSSASPDASRDKD